MVVATEEVVEETERVSSRQPFREHVYLIQSPSQAGRSNSHRC